MDKPHPTEIRRQAEASSLRVVWSDGHTADYGYDYLRGYCPCASCQGHGPDAIRFHQPEVSVEPIKIQPVGNYGVSIHWTDRHATGIYRFDFLREICPCEPCRAEREAGAKQKGEDQ